MDEGSEEETPLLNHEGCLAGSTGSDTPSSFHPYSSVVLYFMAIHFLLAFSEMTLVAPLIKLFEESLCLTHYKFPSGGIDETLCKIPDVQRPLATIRGWKAMFDTLPGRLAICDGRKPLTISQFC
jgi:hypothetical protein